jgi:hypothetical protein
MNLMSLLASSGPVSACVFYCCRQDFYAVNFYFFRISKLRKSRSIYSKCQMAISGVLIMYLEIPETLAASVGGTEGPPHGDKCC